MENQRRKKLTETLKNINKNLGKDFFGFADESPDKESISFGVPALDTFYGGGIPRRKFTVDFGAEDTGKSTRALHLVANAQKEGLIAAYIDLERKFDKKRAIQLEVNVNDLVLSQTAKTAEDAMDAIRTLAQNKVVDLIIVDSIQAMSPTGEQETKKGVEKSMEEDEMALLARKLGKFFRVISPDIFNANIAVYLIGQVRTNIGGFFAYADLSGGNALKHWMSVCTFSRKGQKADYPTEKVIRLIETPDGIHNKTENIVIGFDCVLKMIKSHISNSVRENSEIHIPFYYLSGFKKINKEEGTEQVAKPSSVEVKDASEPSLDNSKEEVNEPESKIPKVKELKENTTHGSIKEKPKIPRPEAPIGQSGKRGRGRPKKDK